jgi:hypothetical protein
VSVRATVSLLQRTVSIFTRCAPCHLTTHGRDGTSLRMPRCSGTSAPYSPMRVSSYSSTRFRSFSGGAEFMSSSPATAMRKQIFARGLGVSAYAVCDVLVYPRRFTDVTRLTTPLKPLEAMALGKAVMGSDLPPMRELIQDGRTGLLFRAGDVHDLVEKSIAVLGDSALRTRLGTAAREWTTRERQWPTVMAAYGDAYAAAMGRHDGGDGKDRRT